MKKQKLSIVLVSVPKASSDKLTEDDVFYPGDVVAGMVVYNTSSSLKYCCIKVRFTGTVDTKISKVQDQVYVINQQSVLLGNANHESDYVLHEGEYAWPFEFTLPMQHIPSAGKYRHGFVKYSLTAIITSKGFMGGMQEQKNVKQIRIRDLVNCTSAPHADPVEQTVSFNLKPKTNKPKNAVSATVQLGRTAFLPGQQLNPRINIVHPAGLNRNPACWIQLVRKERYQAGEHVKEYTQVIAQNSYAIQVDHEDKTALIKALLDIPKDCLYSTSTTKIMTVQYHMFVLYDLRTKTGMFEGRNPSKINKKLRAKLKDVLGGLETQIPITIGTLDDANHTPRIAAVVSPASTASGTTSTADTGSSTPLVTTPTLNSASSVWTTTSSSASNGSVTAPHHPKSIPMQPPRDEYPIPSPKYTPQAELYHGPSSSSLPSTSSPQSTIAHVASGKSRHMISVLSPGQPSSSESTPTTSTGSPSHSTGTSTFSLQPILNALPDNTHRHSDASGSQAHSNFSSRRGSHPPLPSSSSQFLQPLAHPAPSLTSAPIYHTLPSRQLHHMAPQGQHNPSAAWRHPTSTVTAAPILPRFYTSPSPSQPSQPSQPSHPSQPSQSSQPSQPSQPTKPSQLSGRSSSPPLPPLPSPPLPALPPLLPRLLSAGGEPSHHPVQTVQPSQAQGTQSQHPYVPPPTGTSLNVFATPAPPRPSMPMSRSALSVPLMAAPGHGVESSQPPILPPRPPPEHAASVPPLRARPQPAPEPNNGNHHYNMVTPGGSHAQQGRYLPRMASTPDLSNGYATSNHGHHHYPPDQKPPPSPAPVTIHPPFNVFHAHTESPTAPLAVDLGYGPASPMYDRHLSGATPRAPPQANGGAMVATPLGVALYTPSASPASSNSATTTTLQQQQQLQRHNVPVGDYFTASSLAPAPTPAPLPHAPPNMAMAAASAPRFSLVFGTPTPLSTAPSTPICTAAASNAATATTATTVAIAPASTTSGHHAGVMVISPTMHDDNEFNVVPPYAPSPANGHRTL